MRKAERKMFVNYISRFLDPQISFMQKVHAFKRYMIMGGQVIAERARGLDYTMIYSTDEDNRRDNGSYTKTPVHVLKRIFDDIPFGEGEKNFLDIGCGKGYVVTMAFQYPFHRIGGIEYNHHLYNVCCNNLKKKRLDTEFIWKEDAKEFQHYDDFNVFFFNNPVGVPVLQGVLRNIVESHKDDKIYIYYVNVNSNEKKRVIENSGLQLVRYIPNERESYFDISIYSNEK